MRDYLFDVVIPVCLAFVVMVGMVNGRACTIAEIERDVNLAKICKEAGGFYKYSEKSCVKNPGIGQ